MAKNKKDSLIPQAEEWMDLGLNVMLIGLHGVGKTYTIKDTCEAKGLTYKYYSCSTLDPWTEIVGVPVPEEDGEGGRHLSMVRPKDIDEADIVVFDELNRADEKVLNAVFEIIQFRSINGEHLPKLQAVWAAINPPGENYTVTDLDPALVDRFDVYFDVQPTVSVNYLTSVGIRKPIAQALCHWWREHNQAKREENWISPRRLEKIGHLYEKTGSAQHAIPSWFKTDKSKLRSMLEEAERRIKDSNGEEMPYAGFRYEPDYLAEEPMKISEHLRDNPDDVVTHKAVASAIEGCQAPRLISEFAIILDELKPALLEAFLTNMSAQKFARFHSEVFGGDGQQGMPDYRKETVEKLVAAVKAEHDSRLAAKKEKK